MNWDDLKIFLAVVDAQSMRAAARDLKVSHTTVSRRIDALEASLQSRLFDRTADGFMLTATGQDLLPVAHGISKDLDSLGRQVAGRDEALSGSIRVTLPDILASHLLMPYLVEFMEAYPTIDLIIDDSMDIADLTRREADVALRFTNAPPDHLIGRNLGTFVEAVYATPHYLADHDPRISGTKARWVGWAEQPRQSRWIAKSPFPDLPARGQIDNINLQVHAIRCGLGIGYLPCMIGDQEPGFIRISEPETLAGLWILSHRDLRTTARMRVFRRFIVERLKRHMDLIEGRCPQEN